MTAQPISVFSKAPATTDAAGELVKGLEGADPRVIVFFAGHKHDGAQLSKLLKDRFPAAEVVGCTTAGEFARGYYGTGGVALLALPGSVVKRCAAAVARFESGDVESSVLGAMRDIGSRLQADLRELDPRNNVGILLNTGLFGHEEKVNEVVGHGAPFLSFVGGTAGDLFELKKTQVFRNGEGFNNASLLLLMELSVPYALIKTCSFEATSRTFKITRVKGRVVYELDGKPVLPTYAEAIGANPEKLDHGVFMGSPLGVMIGGEPWVRSPIKPLPDGGLMFGCAIFEGAELALLRSTDLVKDTQRALDAGATAVGGEVSGAVLFNCAHRKIEIDVKKLETPFMNLLGGYPVAGFNCYGESWLGHINQTLVGIMLGK